MNAGAPRESGCYTERMETVVLVVVALVVAVVAIDGIATLRDGRPANRSDDTEKVIVDLSRRR